MKVNEIKHQAKLAQWKENILDCRSRGISVSEWCAEYGCHKATYYRWEREIFGSLDAQKEGQDPSSLECALPAVSISQPPAFVELPVAVPSSPPSELVANGFQPVAVVCIGKCELRLSNSVSPELMRQLKGLVKLC